MFSLSRLSWTSLTYLRAIFDLEFRFQNACLWIKKNSIDGHVAERKIDTLLAEHFIYLSSKIVELFILCGEKQQMTGSLSIWGRGQTNISRYRNTNTLFQSSWKSFRWWETNILIIKYICFSSLQIYIAGYFPSWCISQIWSTGFFQSFWQYFWPLDFDISWTFSDFPEDVGLGSHG